MTQLFQFGSGDWNSTIWRTFWQARSHLKNTKIKNKRNLTIFDSFTFPSNLRFDEDLGVKLEDVEFAVPKREDIEEYPEVKEVGPEVISELLLTLKMGGKETGCPAWIPERNPIELPTLEGGDPDLLRVRRKFALKIK